jgi:hypothetical protein
MIDIDGYWRQNRSEKEAVSRFGQIAFGQAKTGEQFAHFARFVVSAGLMPDLGEMLWTAIVRRIAELSNLGDPRPMLENVGGFGAAIAMLTHGSESEDIDG